MERYGAGRDGLPSSGFRCNDAAALPRRGRAALAAGVRELNAGCGAMRAHETRDARERLDVLVLPDAGIGGRYWGARLPGGGFSIGRESCRGKVLILVVL